MEFFEVLNKRVSVRSYNGKPVSDEQIEKILEMAKLAPTAGGVQAYKVYVARDEKILELAEMAKQKDRIKGAGAMIVFFACPEMSGVKYGERGKNLYAIQDATLLCAYAQLAATAEGLSTLWVGAFEDEAARKICGVENEAGLVPVAMLAVGYSDAETKRSERKKLDVLK